MRTDEERVASLHARMKTRRRMRERRKTGALGAACVVLTLCLFLVIWNGGMLHSGGTAAMYSGALMLFENAGAYILLAIAAFMAGVIVTVVIRSRRGRGPDNRAGRTIENDKVAETGKKEQE